MDEQSFHGPCLMKQVVDERKPTVGQEFGSIEDAYDFYNQYARDVGFSVRIGSSKRKNSTHEITWKQFVCSKQGDPDETYQKIKKNASTSEERNRGTTRVGCKAKLSISRNKSGTKWSICNFEEGHNHVLSTPTKVHLLPSHRKVSNRKKILMDKLSIANVTTSQKFRIMETKAGGIQNVGCIDKDLRNYERDLKEKINGHDADMLLEYFDSEKEKNPSFYFEVDRDENNRMSRCFWVDSTARKAYFFFGDVAAFDMTYNTNKYGMIFAPFIGVNHHEQTIIFGCGFLSDEKTESFIWLFGQWLKAMPTGPPQMIITDQDLAITKAIAQVLPLTFDRYCIWHIMDKFPQKIGPFFSKDYYALFRTNVYNSETIEEYEESWKDALSHHSKLEENDWLHAIYEICKQWVPVFCKHKFSAGMSSSQRVESGHAFFKKFVSKNNSLSDFATRFDRALRHQRHQELISDHVDINEVPKLKTLFPIEKQMCSLYTKKIFLKFQEEVIKSTAYLKCDVLREDEKEIVYVVVRANEGSSRLRHIVHDKISEFAKCSCQNFEFKGIPCRHIVFLPKKYAYCIFAKSIHHEKMDQKREGCKSLGWRWLGNKRCDR